jgi:hypothetical protein
MIVGEIATHFRLMVTGSKDPQLVSLLQPHFSPRGARTSRLS